MTQPTLQPSSSLPPSHHSTKQKSDLHMSRKIWHCVGICIMAMAYNLLTIRACWILVGLICCTLLPLDFLRLRRPMLNKLTHRIFGGVMRRHEATHLSGMTYLFLGCVFLLLINKKDVVTLTLLFLAFGDPVASFFGIRFGKDRIIGHKTLQGTMGAFVICTLLAALYYYFNNIMTERLLIVAPLSGLIGALAELLPIGKLDDNLTFPIVSSLLLLLLFQVYGGFGGGFGL